ncbi:hypothetical protein LO762_02265 [Actinocorallia sp. API 0066]|uniref:hypothetical protein n=1 Tax=Actinocorallia sp. API 0066 TaxID=2896846 RepID=UPI001E5F1714|nr:hypothetical protein [Actinocorallia sp. API 0066]MCD0448025.1 hypothetical protein [Actinocorallia sp. API 0066]
MGAHLQVGSQDPIPFQDGRMVGDERAGDEALRRDIDQRKKIVADAASVHVTLDRGSDGLRSASKPASRPPPPKRRAPDLIEEVGD